MAPRLNLYLVVALLLLVGFGSIIYKVAGLGFPLLPGEKKSVWTIEARIEFEAENQPVLVSFALPDNPPKMRILKEDFASSGYGFSETDKNGERRAQWSVRDAEGIQRLYYRMNVYAFDTQDSESQGEKQADIDPPEFDEPFKTAAQTLLDDVYSRSSTVESMMQELLKELISDTPSQNVRLLLGEKSSSRKLANLLVDLLAMAKVPARHMRGLFLEDQRRRQSLTTLVEVFDGEHWITYNQNTGEQGMPENFILWQRGGRSLLDVTGAQNSRVYFSMIENRRAADEIAVRYAKGTQSIFSELSIYSLPIEEQSAFKSILLVPIGALVVVIMRILVGIRTSGTFMPILIALAFIQTTLLLGLLIFIVVVGIGLIIRSWLSRLNLLLVARISAVMIVVIGIMAGFSIATNQLGFSQALTITFFPMIILAWTIERMSILWEEDGSREVLIQGSGSLLVAIIAYLLMTNRIIEYLTFNFPELLLVNLALILLCGQYTGYRLTEFWRFKHLRKTEAE